MLVLTRMREESILIPEAKIEITVERIEGNQVRLGIKAPKELNIVRREIASADQINQYNSNQATLCGVRTSKVGQDQTDSHIGSSVDLLG